MTFVDELKELSKTVELKHKLDRQFAELKARMKTAASNGYRYFKVEIFTLDAMTEAIYLPDVKLENYYCFYTTDEMFYTCELINFLAKLGFDTAELSYVNYNNSKQGYNSLSVLLEW
jgi:hypothetical protein